MSNFWHKLPRPIFALAPMEEVTDFAFREMFARYSKNGNSNHPVTLRATPLLKKEGNAPQLTSDSRGASPPNIGGVPRAIAEGGGGNNFVMFTEFINVDGLTHPEGRKNLAIDLKYSEKQRPIVAQIWGNNPAKFGEAAKIVADLGFDGIDINMGCPQDKEIGIGACAALIREPKLAQEIIVATQKGGGGLPVSVKTRLGYSKTDEMEGWIENLLEMNIQALTLHARTKQEKSKVPAHWEKVAEAVQIRDKCLEKRDKDNRTLIIGNGDIKSRQEGLERIAQTKCDGVMVGRGAFGNPWFFAQQNLNIVASDKFMEQSNIPYVAQGLALPNKQAEGLHYIGVKNRLQVMFEHAELFQKELGNVKSFYIMRKHFKAYCSGFPGAHELRAKLMEAKDLQETKNIIQEYLPISGQGNF